MTDFNKDPRIINFHKNITKIYNIKLYNKYDNLTLLDINYIVNTDYYNPNKLYILNKDNYFIFLKKKYKICKSGFFCKKKCCNFMHLRPSLICVSYKYKNIKCNKKLCKNIHLIKCKFDLDCVYSNCGYHHSNQIY